MNNVCLRFTFYFSSIKGSSQFVPFSNSASVFTFYFSSIKGKTGNLK